MKTKPIDLNAIEVIALLSNGNVQIRRKVKPKSGGVILGWAGSNIAMEELHCNEPDTQHVRTVLCPYGQVGDRLFVREAFAKQIRNVGGTPHEQFVYKASNPNAAHFTDCNGKSYPVRWKTAPKMARQASRLTLEIKEISVVLKDTKQTKENPNQFMWVIKFEVIQGGAI